MLWGKLHIWHIEFLLCTSNVIGPSLYQWKASSLNSRSSCCRGENSRAGTCSDRGRDMGRKNAVGASQSWVLRKKRPSGKWEESWGGQQIGRGSSVRKRESQKWEGRKVMRGKAGDQAKSRRWGLWDQTEKYELHHQEAGNHQGLCSVIQQQIQISEGALWQQERESWLQQRGQS